MSMATNPGWHRGDWMQTFTGRKFYPMDPQPEDVDPLDIAHHLSLLCRYAGAINRFYSVAEHCVLVSWWLASVGCDQFVQLEGLLHDATEAYCVDVPRPLKQNLPDYQMAEARIAAAVAQRFGFLPIEHAIVREADTRILLDERAALMGSKRAGEWGIDALEPLGIEVFGWSPPEAEARYLDRLVELGVEVSA